MSAYRRTIRKPCLGFFAALFLAATLLLAAAPVQAQFSIADNANRPFVIGWVPVFSGGRLVGGVSIDAQGAVARSDVETLGRLRDVRVRALQPLDDDLRNTVRMRKVSLRGLQAEIERRRRERLPLSDELQNLAGLQRVEYVLVYPELHDIVLAGFAEGWIVDAQGTVVGQTTRKPTLQLDDLVVALRAAATSGAGEPITCSIDPTEEGSRALRQFMNRRGLQINAATVARFEQVLGPQQITLTGVAPSSRFAQVLVAADYMMKRLAMNLEPSRIDGLPSYMELLQDQAAPTPRNSMPRWWMAPDYEPLLKDEEGLAWQLRGTGVKALTEDGFLGTTGNVVRGKRENPLAQKWAEAMTTRYAALSAQFPIFAELRNCMDLAVVATLLVKEQLPQRADCDLSLLLDGQRIAVAEYPVPKTIDSRASLVRKGQQWIVSVSGGVELDAWTALDAVEVQPELAKTRALSAASRGRRWWWD